VLVDIISVIGHLTGQTLGTFLLGPDMGFEQGSVASNGGAGDQDTQDGVTSPGGTGPDNPGGPILRKSSAGVTSCTSSTYSKNGVVISEVMWSLVGITNDGQSGTADITVTVTEGTNSYVEHEQFSVSAGASYSLSVGVPAVPKSGQSCPSPSPVLKAVVSFSGSPTDVTMMNDVPVINIPMSAAPTTCSWNESTGPSTTTIGPSSQVWPTACN
jgi:hypothetical protein